MDDHSASRRVDVLQREAPHLIEPTATEIPNARGRRWERFVLVPDEDESVQSIGLKIGAAINAHMRLS